jgi:hypothetical protein
MCPSQHLLQAFKNTFFTSPEADTVDLVIPDPLSPGHPQVVTCYHK